MSKLIIKHETASMYTRDRIRLDADIYRRKTDFFSAFLLSKIF
jgi:hypothetical protein